MINLIDRLSMRIISGKLTRLVPGNNKILKVQNIAKLVILFTNSNFYKKFHFHVSIWDIKLRSKNGAIEIKIQPNLT